MATILIIEDEASIRKLAAVNLTVRGHVAIAVESAEEGLEQLHSHHVSLILLDIKLPGMRGWDFLSVMASDPLVDTNIPVIVMTASAADSEVQAGYPNVIKILLKPFSIKVLMLAVADALRSE